MPTDATGAQATVGRRPRLPLIVAAASAIVIIGAGACLTDLGPWYRGLRVPAWKPPDWLFGPMWTVIFALWVAAVDVAWRNATGRADRFCLLACLALNGVLNVLWSALFFHMRRPDWALIEIGFLWFSVPLVMYALWRTSRWAGWLLAPYLAWVSVAALLNLAIVRLNYHFVLGAPFT